MKIDCKNPVAVAKRMFYLAWKACGGTTGLGFLQDRPEATENEIWSVVTGQITSDYPTPAGEILKPYGDYVFGRMMKFGVEINDNYIIVSDSQPRMDYQSWCVRYSSYQALAEAARKEVES